MASLAVPRVNRPNRKYSNVLVSSPTPERLRNIPHLKPTLKTWISGIPSLTPPDMTPWSLPREKPHHVWLPEGSCFPPSYLKRCLRDRRGHLAISSPLTSGNSRPPQVATSNPTQCLESPPQSHSLRRCASHNIHRTRAQDRSLPYTSTPLPSVRARMKQRRWSLGVPPSYLSTEFITRRLDSHCIIGTNSAKSDTSNDSPSLPLPAIKVSTSTTTIAISFPGSHEGSTLTPEPLAIRRGKKMLAPLTLHTPQRVDEEYPGIPTAFLGTPSVYSPHFLFSSSTPPSNAGSLAISDMIRTLRCQVADLKLSSPTENTPPLLDVPSSSVNSPSAASSDITPSASEDDWAFAKDLMSRYGDHANSWTPDKEKYSQEGASFTRKSLTPKTRIATQQSRARRASVPSAPSSTKNRSKSSSVDLAKSRLSMTAPRQSRTWRQSTPRTGAAKHAYCPTSSPGASLSSEPSFAPSHAAALALDSSPNHSNKEFLNKRPPGILKHVKSVRFANMPKRDGAKDDEPLASQHRVSISGRSGNSPSLLPSPLRACFMPEEPEDQTPSRQPRGVQVTEESLHVLVMDRGSSAQLSLLRQRAFLVPTLPVPKHS
ncbi:hypothetical protein BGW80DRAFT_1457303 [Lactifluus volemus]|nr:hypothetical protein BGW80DRAFT_1457303 [Lactifluus volemus]